MYFPPEGLLIVHADEDFTQFWVSLTQMLETGAVPIAFRATNVIDHGLCKTLSASLNSWNTVFHTAALWRKEKKRKAYLLKLIY